MDVLGAFCDRHGVYHTYTIGVNVAYGLETALTVLFKIAFISSKNLLWDGDTLYSIFSTPPSECCLLGLEM